MASQEIETLTAQRARLPGLGPRSARRAVLWLLKRRDTALSALVEALDAVRQSWSAVQPWMVSAGECSSSGRPAQP